MDFMCYRSGFNHCTKYSTVHLILNKLFLELNIYDLSTCRHSNGLWAQVSAKIIVVITSIYTKLQGTAIVIVISVIYETQVTLFLIIVIDESTLYAFEVHRNALFLSLY